MKIKAYLSSAFCLFAIGTMPAGAAVLAAWTFQPQPFTDAEGANLTVGPSVTASSGIFSATSTATGFHASAASDWTTPAGNISSDSYSVNTFTVGDYFQFATESTGYSGITITFDQTGSSTGPKDFKVQYSTDGSSFTDLTGGAYVVLLNGGAPNTAWGPTTGGGPAYSFSFSLATVTALDNDASIFFRLSNTTATSIGGGTVSTGGTSRIDNFVVTGATAVPEPEGASIIGALGVLALFRRRR